MHHKLFKEYSFRSAAEVHGERVTLTEALNMSCHLKHMAVAACGQHTKSHRGSGRSPSKKGGGLNWGRTERLDGSSDGQCPKKILNVPKPGME